MTLIVSFISENLIKNINVVFAFLILIIIIFIGILFDIIGVAVTAADEPPFHAMSANKQKGSKEAVILIRNADIVSNFCNDVIGDIAGTLSGAAGATLVYRILRFYDIKNNDYIFTILMTSIIATIMVGGKAIGKTFAISKSKQIVLKVGILIYFLKEKLGLNLLQNNGKARK
ncbi:MAG TPA: hypothetical protein GXZ31_00445 [Thermoanaerobacterales bacterium]|nr:hypothetical protein [Thermoanaerobacterales bacterium]